MTLNETAEYRLRSFDDPETTADITAEMIDVGADVIESALYPEWSSGFARYLSEKVLRAVDLARHEGRC
jgi:hypothetical protein